MRITAPAMLVVAASAATTAILRVPSAEAAEARRVVIDIRAFKFDPRTVTVEPGDILVWKNRDIVPHTATANDRRWDSPSIETGGEWETTITESMAGGYTCRFHPSMDATLMVNVVKRDR
jgi:plastocyanin